MAKGKLKTVLAIFFIMAGGALAIGYYFYKMAFDPVVKLKDKTTDFYIRTGWDEAQVFESLVALDIIIKPDALKWVMEQKGYEGNKVVPGKYVLSDNMSASQLIDHLRFGNGRVEVKIVLNHARTLQEIAGKVSQNIEVDSVAVLNKLTDPEVARKYGFTPQTFKSMFLPDTYYAQWNTDADDFLERMAGEYKKFWTPERIQKAKNLNLSQSEVTTLASIVQAEQQLFPDERPRIAGLYLNRLKRGMRLQSDPTVVFAIGDFNINRVLTKHLSFESPYNTYLHAGLPPGPINIPSKQSIDAVLEAEENDYLYMCAKEDFSGYHAFATNFTEHSRNARAFQKALNQRKIYR